MTPTLQVPIDYRLAADGTLQSTPSCNVEECRASIASVRGVLRKLETFFCEFLDEIENVSAPIALDLLEFEGIPIIAEEGYFIELSFMLLDEFVDYASASRLTSPFDWYIEGDDDLI